MAEYRQLEIYWVNLDPTVGRETQKKRPCVIIQSDVVNKKSQTLIAAPLLSDHKPWPFAVNIAPTPHNDIAPTPHNGLDKERHLNLKQLRVVDIMRLENKQGQLEVKYWAKIKQALGIVFGL